MSSVIARETEAYPQPSLIEGMLAMDHQGYYNPTSFTHRFGIVSDAVADAINASRMTGIAWPFPGPNPSNSQNAYAWISQQLLIPCDTTNPVPGCNDIRSAYINQNVSPSAWLDQLSQLSYQGNSPPNTDQQDFDAMKAQLATEFQYLASVRLLQNNIMQIYQSQQSNVGLELQQAQDQITNSAQITLNTTTPSASWIGILQEVISVMGAVGGFASLTMEIAPAVGPAIGLAASLGELGLQVAATETNQSDGTSLQAEEAIETQAGSLAAKAADEYARTLVQLGNQFDRVVTDWGRLKALGGPLVTNQLPWDANASGLLLQAYNRVILRHFYARLLPVVAQVNNYNYTSDHAWAEKIEAGGEICDYVGVPVDPYWHDSGIPVLLYPNVSPNTDTSDQHGQAGQGSSAHSYPFDYTWTTLAMLFNANTSQSCATSGGPATGSFGLFAPIDPANLNSLGAYRFWFFTRYFQVTSYPHQIVPCYDDQC